jgi:hypothetical protein
MMTDTDWDTFGKIFLDVTGSDQSAAGNTGRGHVTKPPEHSPKIVHAAETAPVMQTPPHNETARTGEKVAGSGEKATEPGEKMAGSGEKVTEPAEKDRPRLAKDSTGEINFPPQHGPLVTGSEFFHNVLHADAGNAKVKGLTGVEREKAILKEIEAGNVPDFLRHPKEITVTDKLGNKAVMKVMPDYLAIGTNEDFVRVPVTPLLAKTIAEKYGLALPTKKVVDDIYKNADIKLTGQGLVHDMSDTKYMDGNGFYLKHDQKIHDQLLGKTQDALVAGQKKDIIVSKYLQGHPDRLDFYGLFDKDGHAIQGAHGGPHENTYVDYSHGARFICQNMVVNGRPMTYDQVLKDPRLAGLLSDEGSFETEALYKQPKNPSYSEVV